MSKKSKQFYSPTYGGAIGVSYNKNNNNYADTGAVAYGTAGDFSRIPSNHPIITDLHRPRYVEKLHFYEDTPARNSETDAVSLEGVDDTYYRPFSDKHLFGEAKSYSNCESILSTYVCQDSPLCGWDNMIRSCVYVNRSTHDIRFKEKSSRLRKNRKYRLHKNKH